MNFVTNKKNVSNNDNIVEKQHINDEIFQFFDIYMSRNVSSQNDENSNDENSQNDNKENVKFMSV